MKSSHTSDPDADKRIRSVVAAFGALWTVLCNFTLEGTFRGKVYLVLVLAVLLYGSEVWCELELELINSILHRSQCCGVKWGCVRCTCGQCRERRHWRARVCKVPG